MFRVLIHKTKTLNKKLLASTFLNEKHTRTKARAFRTTNAKKAHIDNTHIALSSAKRNQRPVSFCYLHIYTLTRE